MLTLTVLLVVVSATIGRSAVQAANSQPRPATVQDTTAIQLPAGLTDQLLQDAYAAFSDLERAAERGANAVHSLRKGRVANVDLTVEQLTAILNEGKGAMVQARSRYADLLIILGITQIQLDAWEDNNPQGSPVYCSLDPNVCP